MKKAKTTVYIHVREDEIEVEGETMGDRDYFTVDFGDSTVFLDPPRAYELLAKLGAALQDSDLSAAEEAAKLVTAN